MLRFRPIAPKPSGGEAASGTAEQASGNVTGRRVKRKYVRVRGRQSKRFTKKKLSGCGKPPSLPEKSGVEDAPSPPPLERGVLTLRLLGETSGSEGKSYGDVIREKCKTDRTGDCGGGVVGLRGDGSVIHTWMVVECVTEDFRGVRLGFSDEEKLNNLEKDTVPGFVSDGTNNVIWVNKAYKKMVAAAEEKGFVVCLVVKEKLPFHPWFACRVRYTQQKGEGQKWNKVVPCDVWRMGFGGFAWKLDVDTALSLGY